MMHKLDEKEINELIYITEREINKIKKVLEIQEDLKETPIYELIKSYCEDMLYFYEKRDYIKTFELVNYIWGLLDALANLKLINPKKEIKKWFKIEQDN